jgi:RIO kinase 1
MLQRDVANLRNFFGRFAPEILATNYGDEIWANYQAGVLTPATPLTGCYTREEKEVDLEGVVREIGDAEREEAARLLRVQAAASA